MNIKVPICLYAVILFFLSCACVKQENSYTIETVDDVKIVKNHAPLWDDKQKITLEFIRKIGELESENENYLLFNVRGVAKDSKENLYINDRGNYRIQKFDKNMRYISTIGREGQGPGEFTSLKKMLIHNDTLFVLQSIMRQISVLTLEGREIRRIKISEMCDNFYISSTCNIIANFSSRKKFKLREINKIAEGRLIAVFDYSGNLLKEFGNYHDYGDKLLTSNGNIFEFIIDNNDNIYVNFNLQNRIEKFSPEGNLIFRASRPLNYKIKNEMIRKVEKASKGIYIDHKNRIWVRTIRKRKADNDIQADYMEFDIFNEDGILLCHVPVQRKENMQIIDDRIYFFENENEMCVYEYKIVDK